MTFEEQKQAFIKRLQDIEATHSSCFANRTDAEGQPYNIQKHIMINYGSETGRGWVGTQALDVSDRVKHEIHEAFADVFGV